jgi:hypothetical protein
LCLWAAGLAGIGCAPLRPKAASNAGESDSSPVRDVRQQIEALTGELTDPGIAATPEVHRKLAMLYVDYRNPKPEYGLALRELELYAARDEGGAKAGNARTWLAVLRQMDGLEREIAALRNQIADKDRALSAAERKAEQARKEGEEAKKTAEAQAREKSELVEVVKQLRKDNEEMKETIEKLKTLDVELEELRRKIRP